jgi:hypothetical protein
MFGKLIRTGVVMGVGRYAWRNRERIMATGRSAMARRRRV